MNVIVPVSGSSSTEVPIGWDGVRGSETHLETSVAQASGVMGLSGEFPVQDFSEMVFQHQGKFFQNISHKVFS